MLKKCLLAGVTALAAGSLATTPVAAQSAPTREAPNPWLDCGIGAMIFPSDNVEAAAGISNIIWDLGTTAVTSAASTPDSCAGSGNVVSAQFIQSSYAQLEVELAKGEGEHLSTLASLAGCAADQHDAFLRRVRAKSADVFARPGYADLEYEQKAATFYAVVEHVAATEFADTCVAA